MTEREHDDADEVWRGVGLVLLLHVLQVPLAFLTSFVSVMLVGLSQLLYILPAILIYIKKGRRGMVNGLNSKVWKRMSISEPSDSKREWMKWLPSLSNSS